MSMLPAKLAHTAQVQNTQPDFKQGTLGAFLLRGHAGWPQDFGVHLDGASVHVASSEVRFECQQCCTSESGREVSYVRVSLDFAVERDGKCDVRHVEELFPCFIMEVLNMPLDEDAAARVRRTIVDTLCELDAEQPVTNLVENVIAPMRLYEPLLNALISPPQQDSLAAWLCQHIEGMLCSEDRTIAEVTVNGQRVRVRAREVAMQHNLRASGEVKVVGEVEVCCAQTGAKKGEWKSRAVLMKPSLIARSMPSPDSSCKARMDSLGTMWRERLEQNLSERLASGDAGRFRLSEVLPELTLCQRDGLSQVD